ncbi:MAG: hypothetical protein NZM26_00185 [Patescibacteria group bacterium]|nr:hypothetical protein [Patescibacteria group bacterium]
MDVTNIKQIFVTILSVFYIFFNFTNLNRSDAYLANYREITDTNANQTEHAVNQNDKKNVLFEEINEKRVSNSVNKLELRDDLCKIADVRLNEQIKNGKLDGHIGFEKIKTNHPDLSAIIDNYSLVAEFLAYKGRVPKEIVIMWDNSNDHKKLFKDQNLKYGCALFKYPYAVAIAAN